MQCLPNFHLKTCGDNAGPSLAVSGVLRTSAFFSLFFLILRDAGDRRGEKMVGAGASRSI